MKKLSLVSTIAASLIFSVNAEDKSTHIVNGSYANVNDFSSIASIFTYAVFDDGSFIIGNRCGASILDEWHILTAAHCVSNQDIKEYAREFTIVLPQLQDESSFDSKAEYDSTTKYWVEKIYVHGDYDPDKVVNDIAVLKLETPMVLASDDKVKYAPDESYRLVTDDSFIAVGHGRTSSIADTTTALQKTNLKVYPNYPNCGYKDQSPSTQLCMYSDNIVNGLENSTCSGDSGGPLYWTEGGEQYQIGLTSYGPGICGDSNAQGATSVFTEINDYEGWIQNIKEGNASNVVTYSTSEAKRDSYRQNYTASNGNASSNSSSSSGGSLPLWSLLLLPIAGLLRRK